MKKTIETAAPHAGGRHWWRHLTASPATVAAMVFLAALCSAALAADYIDSHSPLSIDAEANLKPFFLSGGSMEYPLGTDSRGRCLLSRLLHGARYTLSVSAGIVLMAAIIAVCLGLGVAVTGGMLDLLVMRLMDVLLALPTLLLAFVVVAVVGKMDLYSTSLALVVVYTPHLVRYTRAEALRELSMTYCTAARVDGAGVLRLMTVTVLPNCMGPVLVQGTMSFSNAILDIAALGFLGLGVEPPKPEWGKMLSDSRGLINTEWWIPTFIGMAILSTVLALNVFGDGLRDALDPKLRKER